MADDFQARPAEDFREGADAGAVIFADVVGQIFPGDQAIVNFFIVVALGAKAPAGAQAFDVPVPVFQFRHAFHNGLEMVAGKTGDGIRAPGQGANGEAGGTEDFNRKVPMTWAIE